jgi:hypothetical protein
MGGAQCIANKCCIPSGNPDFGNTPACCSQADTNGTCN